jgi:hypothetical protein
MAVFPLKQGENRLAHPMLHPPSMMTIVLIIAGLWMLVSLVFCAALGFAAIRPIPQLDRSSAYAMEAHSIEHAEASHAMALAS